MAMPARRLGGKKSKSLAGCGIFALIFMLLLGINMQEYKSIKKQVEASKNKSITPDNDRTEMEKNPDLSSTTVTSDEEDEDDKEILVVPEEGVEEEEKAAEEESEEEKEEEEKAAEEDKEVNWVESEHKDEDDEEENNENDVQEEEEEEAAEEKKKEQDNDQVENESVTTAVGDEAANKPAWWDSSKSTVIALAAGYGISTFEQFVGTLRATGYQGHIILGVAPDPASNIVDYFQKMNVIWKEVPISTGDSCTYPDFGEKCVAAYPDYKLSWGRFPLARDWLLECEECTGGVMLTDSRDAYFQTDPFSYPFGDKPMEELPAELLVFEEIPEQTTSHWLTAGPIGKCKKERLDGHPMLCSGSTMGTRKGILDYIDVMMEEFDNWKEEKDCRSDMVGDDQSIHNYLYYKQRFKNVASIPHRTGPIHIVGVQADQIFRATIKKAAEEGYGEDLAKAETFVNQQGYMHWGESKDTGTRPEDWRTWLPAEHELIDPETGFILNLDGKPSPQVHQFDRFGLMLGMPFLLNLVENGNSGGQQTEESFF
mmetsp:Transcript_7581/g.11578  ORF Transcript_7581/g.11578 Transcript_7581/m.11578 type:complete len:541 (-) Transcript_7581:147-1769(-)